MFANLHFVYLFPKKAQTLPSAELRPLKPVSSRLQVELKFPLMHDIAQYTTEHWRRKPESESDR